MTRRRTFINLENLVLVVLFAYPLLHKVRIRTGIVIHPADIVLLFMWMCSGWWLIKWARTRKPINRNLRLALPLLLSFTGLITVMEISILLMMSRGVSPAIQDILLPLKYLLYLAPLPFVIFVIPSIRPPQITRVLVIIAASGLITILYSLATVGNVFVTPVSPGDIFMESTRMEGFLGEVYIPGEGLTYRKDTVAHGAYGEYLALVALLSLSYSLNGRIHLSIRAFLFLTGIAAMLTVSQTSSRISVLLLFSGLVLLPFLLHHRSDRKKVLVFLVALFLAVFAFRGYLTNYTFTFYKYKKLLSQESPVQINEFEKKVAPGPLKPPQDHSLKGRKYILLKSLAFIRDNSGKLVFGIGFSRDNFLREVAGTHVTDDRTVKSREFQTAHNMFLDVLIKCGIFGLIFLVCVWIFLLFQPLLNVLFYRKGGNTGTNFHEDPDRSYSLYQAGLTAFLVPFLLVNFLQEDLLVDIILFHIMCLAGVYFSSLNLRHLPGKRNRLKIVHLICSGGGVGGGNTHVLGLATALSAEGHPQWIISPPSASGIDQPGSKDVRIAALPVQRLNPWTAVRVLWVIRTSGADILHSHGRGAGLYSVLLSCFSGSIGVHTPHGPHFLGKKGIRLKMEILSRKLVAAFNDVSVYVSEGERKIFSSRRIAREGAVVIENGLAGHATNGSVSFDRYTAREKLGLPSEGLVIGTIARLNYQKGIDELIDVASLFLEQKEAIFIVIGDGPERESLESRLKVAKLGSRFLLTGERDEAHRYLPAMDIYVSTARWEGLPYTILEAMDNHIPIVAADVVGNRDALRFGGGLLVEAGDKRQFAGELARLSEEEGLYAELAIAGPQIVRTNFPFEVQIEKTLETYQEAAALEGEREGSPAATKNHPGPGSRPGYPQYQKK